MNSMDSVDSVSFDIVEVYRRYCDIRLGNCFQGNEDYRISGDECRMVRSPKEELAQLTELVKSSLCAGSRTSIFDEIRKLMLRLNLTVDSSEFSRLYEFVYFICRENGQKTITVKNAVSAWRLVLLGRFRLLNQWCEFVEVLRISLFTYFGGIIGTKKQRHNISEDTWRQVLAFSRCVHENLEGYDPAGAWPVLIDDFVEYMYSVSGPYKIPSNSEAQLCTCADPLPGLKSLPGIKRKPVEDMESDDVGSLVSAYPESTDLSPLSFKRYRSLPYQPATNELVEITRRSDINSSSDVQSNACSPKSKCAVDGVVSQGLAGLLPTGSCLQFEREKLAHFVRNYKKPSSEKVLPRVT